MQIKKRSGALEEYNSAKITGAIKKAFLSVGQQVEEAVLADLLAGVESRLPGGEVSVEQIQDLVERVMMEQGHYDAAKSYILYRQKRAELRSARQALAQSDRGRGPGGMSGGDTGRI